ncbi:MAG: thiamine pyrophosphate-dependent enzyme [Bacillota bacterium]
MMRAIYARPRTLTQNRFHYCPGCGHGVVHRLVAEVIDEMSMRERTVGVAPVGCSVLMYNYLDLDMQEAAHGRAPAVATGIKRVLPDRLVFTYQGDGDLASIGMAEIIHAAARGENISVFFINNANYGMTGGQLAPTTLPGQKTSTSPLGRDVKKAGNPVRVAELLSSLEGPAFITRTAIYTPAEVMKTKKAIKKAFLCQAQGLGFSLVEILSPCPNNWGMDPLAALRWVKEKMTEYYPLGTLVDKTGGLPDSHIL